MSYTQHTWVNGETVTADKMNNIEEGVTEAMSSGGGGAKTPIVYCTISNSGSRMFGTFQYAKEISGVWQWIYWAASYLVNLYAIGVCEDAVYISPFPVPEDDDVILCFIPSSSAIEVSGNVSDTTVTVEGDDCYIIYGDFSVKTT